MMLPAAKLTRAPATLDRIGPRDPDAVYGAATCGNASVVVIDQALRVEEDLLLRRFGDTSVAAVVS